MWKGISIDIVFTARVVSIAPPTNPDTIVYGSVRTQQLSHRPGLPCSYDYLLAIPTPTAIYMDIWAIY